MKNGIRSGRFNDHQAVGKVIFFSSHITFPLKLIDFFHDQGALVPIASRNCVKIKRLTYF